MGFHRFLSSLIIASVLFLGVNNTVLVQNKDLTNAASLNQVADYTTPDKSVVANSNNFGLNIFKNTYAPDVNTIVSPTSLYIAFSMLYNGASENTQKQMRNCMGITTDTKTFNENIRSLQQSLLADRIDTEVMLSNSIWFRESLNKLIKPDFLFNNSEYFGALLAFLDFNSSSAPTTINKWVSDNTKGLIKSVIEDGIDPSTMLYLINTVYFKAKWRSAFESGMTYKETFNTPAGKINVDTMHNSGYYEFVDSGSYKAIKLPYTDGRSSMLLILPEGDLSKLVDKIDSSLIDSISKSMKRSYVKLSMPKVDVQCEMHPNAILSAMGMSDMFSPNAADFTGITDSAKLLELHVSDVLHKTVLKIDEEGTEAAAVTSITMKATSALIDQPAEMKIDRPFFLAVVDDEAGVVFAGTIVDPRK